MLNFTPINITDFLNLQFLKINIKLYYDNRLFVAHFEFDSVVKKWYLILSEILNNNTQKIIQNKKYLNNDCVLIEDFIKRKKE